MQPPPQLTLHQQTSYSPTPLVSVYSPSVFSMSIEASIASLNTIESVAVRLPHPFVLLVLSLTVAKVDSMGFVVRICIQWAAGKS